jgi:uncharacterized protein YigA (DUF484 family)
MTTQQKSGVPPETISEEAIAHYLQMHPDFFERHPSLLATLKLGHSSGPAVSLIERQVAILRTRHAKLERKLQELVTIANSNDVLSEKIHRLASGFLDATTADEVVAALRKALSSDFGAEFAVLLLFDDAAETAELNGNDWVRRVNRRDESAGGFGSLLGDESPRCGRLTEAQRDFVFGSEDGQRVASAALTPLGSPAIGMLGIGSSDADRFLPTMSVDFLSRVGDLISHAVRSRRS